MTATVSAPTVRAAGEQGPSLVWSAIISAGLFAVSLVIGAVFGGAVYSSPFVDDATIQRYYADHATLVQWIAFFQFAAAIALAVFVAALWARLRALAPEQAGLTYTAVAGGVAAALFLALNAVVQWSVSHPLVIESAPVRRGLHYLYFALGGFAYVAAIGLCVAAVSLVALRARLLPGWFNAASLVVAGLGLASTLTFVTESTTLLIPLGRFPALLWQLALAYLLPKAVRDVRAAG
ncbi:hypothetical protein [Actinophytocola sp.]|uniref:hypothetical protein n=1 Tax=Actinophytocola sp. TaxID=1872138 RepID=UPI003D6A2340